MDCGHIETRLRISKELKKGYNRILEEIDRDFAGQDQRQIKKIVEEIKNDLKSIRIPYSGLGKLKKYEKIYNLALPWVMKVIDFIMKNGSFDM